MGLLKPSSALFFSGSLSNFISISTSHVLKTKSLFKKPVIHQKNTHNTLLEISSFGFQQKETIDENLGVFSTVFFGILHFTLVSPISFIVQMIKS